MADWKKIKIIKSDSEDDLFQDFCKKILKIKKVSEEDLKVSVICDGNSEIIYKRAKEIVEEICEKASLEFDKVSIPVLEVVRRNEKNSMAGVIWFAKYTSPDNGDSYIAYTEKTIM